MIVAGRVVPTSGARVITNLFCLGLRTNINRRATGVETIWKWFILGLAAAMLVILYQKLELVQESLAVFNK